MLNRIRKINSSLAPARAFGGPQTAGIEFDTYSDALIVTEDNPPTEANRTAFPRTFTVPHVLVGAEAATAANYGLFWVAPFACEVVSCKERHATAGTNGSAVGIELVKAATTVAVGSGTVIGASVSLKAAADTIQTPAVSATLATRKVAAGEALGLKLTGDPAVCAGMVYTVELRRTPA